MRGAECPHERRSDARGRGLWAGGAIVREVELLVKVFKATLHAQQNVAEFAGKTIRTREALYPVFTRG